MDPRIIHLNDLQPENLPNLMQPGEACAIIRNALIFGEGDILGIDDYLREYIIRGKYDFYGYKSSYYRRDEIEQLIAAVNEQLTEAQAYLLAPLADTGFTRLLLPPWQRSKDDGFWSLDIGTCFGASLDWFHQLLSTTIRRCTDLETLDKVLITGESHLAWALANPYGTQTAERLADMPELELPDVKYTPEPWPDTAQQKSSACEDAKAFWQEKELNAGNFPEALGAKLMRLNAETGHEIGDGLKGLYATLTDWDKFKAVMNKELPNDREVFEGLKSTYQQIKALPADQRAEGAYKLLVGGLATAGAGKIATTSGRQLGKMGVGNSGPANSLVTRASIEANIADSRIARQASNIDVFHAKSVQIESGYNADDWIKGKLIKEEVIYSLSPNRKPEFFTTLGALQAVRFDSAGISQALQIKEHAIFGYRPDVTGYRVIQDFNTMKSTTLANPQFGSGGGDQFLIRSFEKHLEPLTTIDLKR